MRSRKLMAALLCGVIGTSLGTARGEAPFGQFTLTPETVRDNYTGLTWQRESFLNVNACEHVACTLLAATCGSDAVCTLQEATAYCANLVLGGESDWRVPSMNELHTIADVTRVGPCVDPVAFPATKNDLYWSSTAYPGAPQYAWMVNFNFGSFTPAMISDSWSIRCVR